MNKIENSETFLDRKPKKIRNKKEKRKKRKRK
jgi:hypothetical protein